MWKAVEHIGRNAIKNNNDEVISRRKEHSCDSQCMSKIIDLKDKNGLNIF